MTNREKYAEEILDIVLNGCGVAIKNNEPVHCESIKCVRCDLCGYGIKPCKEKLREWAEQEYVPDVDWSKVAVDTRVLVSDGVGWYRRYFAKYEDGKVYVWINGQTSWSVDYNDVIDWKYVKLAEEEDMK